MVSEVADEADASEIRDIAERLKLAVRAAGGNAYVAEASGVPLRTLNSYMAAAADPKLTKLHRIAVACGTSIDALLGRKLPAETPGNSVVGDKIGMRLNDDELTAPEDFVLIPHLEVRASAGPGLATVATGAEAPRNIAFRQNWLRSLGITPVNAEFIEAHGDSMFPTIQDGDLMLLDRGYGEVVNGKIYVLVVNGLVVVKRVSLLAFGGLMLISDNDRYPAETVARDEVNNLNFQARVAWFGRPI
ncbi:LexA family transcriptional regulator [Methylobacterium sp. WL6]|uniref:XRE family transcriptional regulator n=1 Tax=Methylobacterium sp. WL6 TaxID=2603901 RepID=UPI0011C9F973|nr:LexA family transcriptional regulator [Methylobacterium sp. WL6]TXN71622.1 LexA family transcriptional regulator [Methylobacterium sp. WL6]